MKQKTLELLDEELLNQVRERFCHVESDPISGPRIYLENAGGSLTLKQVVDVVAEQTALPDNAGRQNPTSLEITRLIEKGRKDVSTLLGARSGAVTLGESTTSNGFRVLSAIIRNVPGDNVVTTNLDHPAVFDATKVLCERFGKEWRLAELSPRSGRVPPESILRQIDSNTIVLAMIHSSNITGTTNDVKRAIQEARRIKPDLYVVVDGAQHGPHALVDVEELGCDGYFVSSYKMFSKVGASVAYISDRVSRLPHDRLLGKPEKYWDLGTREQAGYAAWSAVADHLCWLGSHFTEAAGRREQIMAAMGAIQLHERALTFRVLKGTKEIAGLLDMGHVKVYGEVDDLAVREPCVIFSVEGAASVEVVSYLREKNIRVHERISDAYSKHTLQALGVEECVRVSMCHYNSAAEVDSFLRAVEAAKK